MIQGLVARPRALNEDLQVILDLGLTDVVVPPGRAERLLDLLIFGKSLPGRDAIVHGLAQGRSAVRAFSGSGSAEPSNGRTVEQYQ